MTRVCLVEIWRSQDGRVGTIRHEGVRWFVGYVVCSGDLLRLPFIQQPGYVARVVATRNSVVSAFKAKQGSGHGQIRY